MLGDFIPSKTSTPINVDSLIDIYLEQRYVGDIKYHTEGLRAIESKKINDKTNFNDYLSSHMTGIKNALVSGKKEYRVSLRKTYNTCKETKLVLNDHISQLVFDTLKDDLTNKGYVVTFETEHEYDQRDQGYTIVGSELVFKVKF